jgi:hypothetical protein
MTEPAPRYHLAQLNVARLRAPVDSPELAGFVAELAPVNALADGAPGFVWRLQSDGADDATAFRPYPEDDMIMINCSVWASLETLWEFVYRTVHLDVMRQRREWFHRLLEPYTVLWWVPAGHLPAIEEAVARLARLRADGPSEHAFTFKQPYPPPGSADRAADRVSTAG